MLIILNVLGLLSKLLVVIIFSGGGGGGGGVIIKSADFIKMLTLFNIIIQFLKEINPTLIINDARAVNIKNDLVRELFINFKAEGVDELFVSFVITKV